MTPPPTATAVPLSVIEPDGGINGHDAGMSNDELLHCYRTMLRVRAFDETCMKLQRSGRIGFSIPNRDVPLSRSLARRDDAQHVR
jgi:hypothetical protein